MARKSIFVVFEGANRCGKTSHIEELLKRLRAKGRRVVATQEPYRDCEAGRQAADLIHNKKSVDQLKLQRLMVDARACHMKQVDQWLQEHEVVISDRGMLSTVAFGTAAAGDEHWDDLVEMNQGFRKPDLILLIDAPSDVAMARSQPGKPTRFEKKGVEFQERVRQRYLRIAREKVWSNIRVIDNGEHDFETVAGWIEDEVEQVLTGVKTV